MKDAIRESAFGQLVRYATDSRFFRYPDEQEDFVVPWTETKSPDSATLCECATPYEKNESLDSAERTRHVRSDDDDNEIGLPASDPSRARPEAEPHSSDLTSLDKELTRLSKVDSAIVPTKTSDGYILVDWYTKDDSANPQNWSTTKKLYVTMIIVLYTFVVYASSAIYTSAQPQVIREFGLSYAEASAILSLYVAGYGLGPLLFSPMSEVPTFGRNIPYVVSFGLFVILAVPTALVDNYAGLLVLRFLTGVMGSPCLATGGASVADVFSFFKLPYALTAWVAAAFLAPACGPLLSGFAVPVLGWRWAFWEILIMSGPIWVLWFFTMPETSAENILLRRAQRLRKLTGNMNYRAASEMKQQSLGTTTYNALLVPFIITIKDPAVLFVNVFSSIIYGTYYSFFEAFPLTYLDIYGFSIGELGIVYAAAFIPGAAVGMIIYCLYQWFYLEPDLHKRGPRAQEHRLVPATIAVWALPISMFWFGWTATASIHWSVSIIGIAVFGAGAFILFQCLFMYLPLTYPKYAASLFAANDAMRSALAAGSIIFAHPMYVNLGIGRGTSILAGLMVGGSLGVVVLYFIGAKLRARSKFADTV